MFAIRDTTIMILFYFVLRWGSKRRPAHSNSHVSSLPGTVLYVPGTVRFVRVIRVPACARVSRVSRVCPGSPRCLLREGQLETTHANAYRVGHYHTKHCHAAVVSLGVFLPGTVPGTSQVMSFFPGTLCRGACVRSLERHYACPPCKSTCERFCRRLPYQSTLQLVD